MVVHVMAAIKSDRNVILKMYMPPTIDTRPTETVEDEIHVLLYCPVYSGEREELIWKFDMANIIFNDLWYSKRLFYFITMRYVYRNAQTCCDILKQRK